MFRLTIREIVLLTLAVGSALGWCSERWRFAELDQLRHSYTMESAQWQRRARAGKAMLELQGWTVDWRERDISVRKPGESHLVLNSVNGSTGAARLDR